MRILRACPASCRDARTAVTRHYIFDGWSLLNQKSLLHASPAMTAVRCFGWHRGAAWVHLLGCWMLLQHHQVSSTPKASCSSSQQTASHGQLARGSQAVLYELHLFMSLAALIETSEVTICQNVCAPEASDCQHMRCSFAKQ